MVSESNEYYENSDSNYDYRMRVALMPLFKHGAINSKVLVHSHTWASPATGAVHRNLSRSMNTIFYGFVIALPKWETNFGAEMTCV